VFLTNVRRLTATALLVIAQASAAEAANVTLSNARVRALIPGQDATVGYFDITNSGTTDVVLVAARSEGVGAIEMHTIVVDGDMVRMRRLERVIVPAGETIHFKTGGHHLMLSGVAELGQTTQITLLTATGRQITGRFERTALQ
jgi:copper(I)-binding protein